MTKHLGLAIVLGATLAACGGSSTVDGEEFVGTYSVTSHREAHQQGDPVPCSDPGPEIEVGDPYYAAYFNIEIDEFFEDPNFLAFQACDAPGTNCRDIDTLLTGKDGLESSMTSTQGGPGEGCNLYAGRTTLTLVGGVATYESHQWADFDHDDNDCTLDAADELVGTPDCEDVVLWIGTRQ